MGLTDLQQAPVAQNEKICHLCLVQLEMGEYDGHNGCIGLSGGSTGIVLVCMYRVVTPQAVASRECVYFILREIHLTMNMRMQKPTTNILSVALDAAC